MKALHTLDHVLLWYARGFAAIDFIMPCLLLVKSLYLDSTVPVIAILMLAVITALWNVSLWQLHRVTARRYLGITSIVSLLFLSISTYDIIYRSHYVLDGFGLMRNLIAAYFFHCLGLIAILWTALRAPHFQKHNPLLQSC